MLKEFLFDSSFANGAYSHSFGLESYISQHLVYDEASFARWLKAYMRYVFVPNDAAVYVLACRYKNSFFSFLKLAYIANASINSKQVRQASVNMARAILNNTAFMHDDFTSKYHRCTARSHFAHPSLAYACFGDDLLKSLLYSSIKSLNLNATRAIPLPYKATSRLLFDNLKTLEDLSQIATQIADDFCKQDLPPISLENLRHSNLFSTHYELDFATLMHEELDFRLFMS